MAPEMTFHDFIYAPASGYEDVTSNTPASFAQTDPHLFQKDPSPTLERHVHSI